MPINKYKCVQCNHEFETLQGINEESLTKCPECGYRLRKVFKPPLIKFNGGGFYKSGV